MSRVYDLLAPVLSGVGAVVLLTVLVFLLLGSFRKFWIVLFYVVWELVATIGLTIADIMLHGSAQMSGAAQTEANRLYARVYWANDVLVDLLRFVLVMVLIYKGAEGKRQVPWRLLGVLIVLMIVLPFFLFTPGFRQGWPTAKWFNSTSELLNFGAAIMNLVLWGMLIASKRRDLTVLMVSAGLGIVVTGTAISLGIRHLAPTDWQSAGFLFMNVAQIGGWFVWCRAFWPVRRASHALPTAAT
jgi:hypothetical protein